MKKSLVSLLFTFLFGLLLCACGSTKQGAETVEALPPEPAQKAEMPIPGLETVDFIGKRFFTDIEAYDFDGDGSTDPVSFDFKNGGDEAASGFILEVKTADAELSEFFMFTDDDTVFVYAAELEDGRDILVISCPYYKYWYCPACTVISCEEGVLKKIEFESLPSGFSGSELSFEDGTSHKLAE